MASLNVYVPDELKERMDAAQGNWSAIAREAFELHLVATQSVRRDDMNDVIARLKASRQQIDASLTATWKERGREWAAEQADAETLEALAAIDGAWPFDSVFAAYMQALHGEDASDRQTIEEECEYFGSTAGRPPRKAALYSFIEGAQEIWAEVEPHLN